MFDYIVDNTYYDCGYIYSMAFGGPVQCMLRWYVGYDRDNFADKYIDDLSAKMASTKEANSKDLATLLSDIAAAK